ncbi:MAG: substrate-binding domain-containing protein [Vicinamibacterales bacterium]|nr:substrate-binding domain-containing protein [Vicinamibacterales bacterium]
MRPTSYATAHSFALVAALVIETALFSIVAPNFFTVGNFFEITRLSVELGLVAIAMTPILIAGGIDLSVGAMMGLSAVCFGVLSRQLDMPLAFALTGALLVGAAGGTLNALLISWLALPPLIVTLGSMALFRGIAEGMTTGAVTYTGFSESFLFLGQGYLWARVPAQLPLFLLVFAGYFFLLHRSAAGRALYAIGFSPASARYAGLPVKTRIALVYVLSGVVSSLAAIVYVAHLGQAKSDAGNGYELDAITAVVLGGTSVFGGRGRLPGTLLGLLVLSVLQNGLHLAALPSELAGVLTGALLVTTIIVDRVRAEEPPLLTEDIPVKNTQVAILCGAILAGAFIVAGTNVWLVRSITGVVATGERAAPARKLVVAMMPKAKGDPYFVSCRAGAEKAAKELGVDLIWDGPTGLDAAKQNELVENWITRKVDVIAVAVENRGAISSVLRKARSRGIRVLTWDADAEADARDFFVNQATSEQIGYALTDEAARLLGGSGDFAVITGALSAANQNEWIAFIKKRLAEKYPRLKLVTVRPSDDDRDKAFFEAQTILKVHPTVRLIMAISAPAVPGAGEAIRQAGTKLVQVIGLSLPSITRTYLKDGSVQTVILWDTHNLGYLTVQAASRVVANELQAGAASMDAGALGRVDVRGTEIILGPPLLITKTNVDQFDF